MLRKFTLQLNLPHWTFRKGSPLRCTRRNWVGKVGSKSAAQGGTAIRPPPQHKELDWICEKQNFIFFTHKINGKEILSTYYRVQSYSYTKIWWSHEVLKLQCSRWDCSWTPPENKSEVQLRLQWSSKLTVVVGSFTWITVNQVSFVLKILLNKQGMH